MILMLLRQAEEIDERLGLILVWAAFNDKLIATRLLTDSLV